MSDVLEKYRVTVSADKGELWLLLEKRFPAQPGLWKEHWDTFCCGGVTDVTEWRLSGGYIVPSMWSKPMEERIRIAVGYAVDVVKAELAKTNANDKADALAQEWSDKAMAMFKDAVKEL